MAVNVTPQRTFLLLLLAALSSATQADIWGEPHPLRREALLEGRDFEYNSEAFTKRFTFRHINERPRSAQDGIRATAGSVTGDELYMDVHIQKGLRVDGGGQELFFLIQRLEDFDGRFDRQILGIGQYLGEDWRIAAMGDLRADKGETDLYFEGRWQPDADRLIRAAVIFPDLLFASKTGEGEYLDRPYTLFAQARGGDGDGLYGEAGINHSPETAFEDPDEGVTAAGSQTRAMARASYHFEPWLGRLRWEGARSDRRFLFERPDAPPEDEFRRRMYRFTLSATYAAHPQRPELGLRYFRLREDGWSGDARAVRYRERRDELLLYLGATLPTGERHRLRPRLLGGHVDVVQEVERGVGRERDEQEWQGEIVLPWSYTVDAERGGIVTLNMTARLPDASFGGGNVQVHWPF